VKTRLADTSLMLATDTVLLVFALCSLLPGCQTEAVLAKLPVEAVFAAPRYQGKSGLGVLKVGQFYLKHQKPVH